MITAIRNLSLLFMVFVAPIQGVANENTAPTNTGPTNNEANYRACLNMASSNPYDAFDEAVRWEGLGGGHPARYCALAALMGMGRFDEAAQGFEGLANEVDASKEFKARLLSRAAEAWLLFNQLDTALDVIDTAVTMSPDDAEPLVIRAQIFAAKGAFWEATDDLGQAISISPFDADALAFRASAWRQLDVLDLAKEDALRALQIAPSHPAALLELGNIQRIEGDDNQARKNWMTIISTWPTSKAALAAQTNIELLDIKKNERNN